MEKADVATKLDTVPTAVFSWIAKEFSPPRNYSTVPTLARRRANFWGAERQKLPFRVVRVFRGFRAGSRGRSPHPIWVSSVAICGRKIFPSPRRVQAQPAMTVIHHGLAGRGKIRLGNVVKPSAPLHHEAGLAQAAEVATGIRVSAAGDGGEFGDGPRLAAGQFAEHLPARGVAEAADQRREVGQRRRNGGSGGFGGGIHENKLFFGLSVSIPEC